MSNRPSKPTNDSARADQFAAAYIALARSRDEVSWALADLMVSARNGGLSSYSVDLGERLDVPKVKLRDLARVSLAFPAGKRDLHVSFEAHVHLAGLPEDRRATVLAKAATEGWGERRARKAATDYRQERAGFEDEDQETSQAVQIMRAWNRASRDARAYFAEMQQVVGLGLVDEEAACA